MVMIMMTERNFLSSKGLSWRWFVFFILATLCALLIQQNQQVTADPTKLSPTLTAFPTSRGIKKPGTGTAAVKLPRLRATSASSLRDILEAIPKLATTGTKPAPQPNQSSGKVESTRAINDLVAEPNLPPAPPAMPAGKLIHIPVAKAPPIRAPKPKPKPKPLELANIFQDQKVISLGQAAKLMHKLIKDSYDLELRCELYLDLIKQRNSRTEVGVANLIRESSKRVEMPDLDSLNLHDKLAAELEFGALGKVRIFQASFDDEFAEFVEDDMEDVKNDLFDCVAHAADRHQRAISNVAEFVTDTIESIEPLVYDSRHALDRIEEAKQAVSRIELAKLDKLDKRGQWIEAYKTLFIMIINNRYRLTQKVMRFMTTQDSLDILDFMVDTNNQIDAYKNDLVHRESRLLNENKSLQKNRKYKDELMQMFIVASKNLDWLPKRSISFTHQRTRWRIIRNTVLPFHGLSISDVTWSPARVLHRNTFEALVNSCPFYGDYFEDSIRNLNLQDNSMKPETAKWLIERLYPFSLGCKSLEADRNRLPQVRHWYIFSISQSIQRWCLDRLNDPSLPDEDKLTVLSIMRLIP